MQYLIDAHVGLTAVFQVNLGSPDAALLFSPQERAVTQPTV